MSNKAKRRLLFPSLAVVSLAVILSFLAFYFVSKESANQLDTPYSSPKEDSLNLNNNAASSKTSEELIDDVYKSMSTADKAGQMLFFAARGEKMSEKFEKMLQKVKPGGIILMGDNVKSENQVTEFSKQIQSTSKSLGLLIATDQEGGVVKRVKWDNTLPAQELIKLNKEEVCEQAKSRATLLRGIGINTNFAPVVDITNPNSKAFINQRTISPDPTVVAEVASNYVDCFQRTGLSATYKHFPGHGSTTADSHTTLPVVAQNKEQWLKKDAIPFKEVQADLIMVGHLLYPQIDKEFPSSISKTWITDILRNELQYQGVVISDDMNMLHTTRKLSVEEALSNAYNAGIDIVLYVPVPEPEEKIHSKLIDLIDSKKISEDKVERAVKRVLKLKHAKKLVSTEDLPQ